MVQETSETFDDIIQLRTHEETQNTVNRLKLRSKEGVRLNCEKKQASKNILIAYRT